VRKKYFVFESLGAAYLRKYVSTKWGNGEGDNYFKMKIILVEEIYS